MVFIKSFYLFFVDYLGLAWQEPHNEQNIIEISRSTNVIPCDQHLFPSNNTETSSFMKYIHENTNVSYLSIQIFIFKHI
jgi:hypothetical protein